MRRLVLLQAIVVGVAATGVLFVVAVDQLRIRLGAGHGIRSDPARADPANLWLGHR